MIWKKILIWRMNFLIVIAAVKINVLQVLYSMKITDFVMIVYCWQRQVLPLENLLIFKI